MSESKDSCDDLFYGIYAGSPQQWELFPGSPKRWKFYHKWNVCTMPYVCKLTVTKSIKVLTKTSIVWILQFVVFSVNVLYIAVSLK